MVNEDGPIAAIEFASASPQVAAMARFNDTSSLLAFLKSRKSASAKAMTGPGPSASEIDQMLALCVRVPDHGKLAPWRFILFEGAARARIGEKFAVRWKALHPDHSAENLAFQAGLFERAPVVVAVVSTATEHPKIPIWEQQLSAAAVCFNLLLAAQALGYDGQWQTDWVAYDEGAKADMGLMDKERIAGMIYLGRTAVPLEDRPRPDHRALLTRWGT